MKNKWLQILQKGFRDFVLMGFGAWIIWKQVYNPDPNGYLALIGFGFMVPSARAAVLSILSTPASSSESQHPPEGPQLPSSHHGDTGEGT